MFINIKLLQTVSYYEFYTVFLVFICKAFLYSYEAISGLPQLAQNRSDQCRSFFQDLGLKQHDTGPEIGTGSSMGPGYLKRPAGSSGGPSPGSGPGSSTLTTTTPRSRSISSDMEIRNVLLASSASPQGSSDNLDKLSACSPTHHSLYGLQR